MTVSRGYDCLLTVDDDSSKNTTKRPGHPSAMHQCHNSNAAAYSLGFVALRKPRP